MLDKIDKNHASASVFAAHFDTNTAADAKFLGDEGDLGLGADLNAKLAHANHRTRFLALLATLLRLAAIAVHDGYASQRLLLFLVSLVDLTHYATTH